MYMYIYRCIYTYRITYIYIYSYIYLNIFLHTSHGCAWWGHGNGGAGAPADCCLSSTCVTWLTHHPFITWFLDIIVCDSFALFICATWLIHMNYMCNVMDHYSRIAAPPRHVWRDSFLIHVWRDSFTIFLCVTWLICISQMCDVTHSQYSCETWCKQITHRLLFLLDLCDVTHS